MSLLQPATCWRQWSLALLVAVGLLAACRSRQEDQAWERAQQTGTLRVGMDAAYPPFEYVNDQNEIVGFDVDLARELGERMGVTMAFHNITFDGLYDSLNVGQVDLLISALVVGWEVEGRANFSLPYFNAGELLVVPVGSSVQTMNDMAGRTLAVEYGSGGDVEARQWQRRIADLAIDRYDTPDGALQATVGGATDATLVDGISARLGVGQHTGLALADHVTESLFAVAVAEDSYILLEQVNNALQTILDDGTIEMLIEKWFGPQR